MVQNMIKYHPGTALKSENIYFSYGIVNQLKKHAYIQLYLLSIMYLRKNCCCFFSVKMKDKNHPERYQ